MAFEKFSETEYKNLRAFASGEQKLFLVSHSHGKMNNLGRELVSII